MRGKDCGEMREGVNTHPEVFIIESLEPDDEGNGRFEGSILSAILRLHGKNPQYRYVRTREQFERAVHEFGASAYRYLHISAHAEPEGMCTTNQEEIDFDELADILQPHLHNRRLFLSTCSMVHEDLAKAVIPASGCYSVVGPTNDIRFSDAAVAWTSMYHLMFLENPERMTRAVMGRILKSCCKIFDVELAYFTRSDHLAAGYEKVIIRPTPRTARKTGTEPLST